MKMSDGQTAAWGDSLLPFYADITVGRRIREIRGPLSIRSSRSAITSVGIPLPSKVSDHSARAAHPILDKVMAIFFFLSPRQEEIPLQPSFEKSKNNTLTTN